MSKSRQRKTTASLRSWAAGLSVLAAAAMFAPAGAAAAPWEIACPTGCTLTPDVDDDGAAVPVTSYWDDYTVPADGHTYAWRFRLESPDPNARVVLDHPSQVEWDRYYGGGGVDVFGEPPFRFDETVTPHLTTILVSTVADFFDCSPSTQVGRLCGRDSRVWGNGTSLTLFSTSPATLFTSALAVPEPAVWALMIAGLGVVGGALRREQRRAAAA